MGRKIDCHICGDSFSEHCMIKCLACDAYLCDECYKEGFFIIVGDFMQMTFCVTEPDGSFVDMKVLLTKSVFTVTYFFSNCQRHCAILVITQNNCLHKNLLGNKQWRFVDRSKHCERLLLLK